MRKKIFSLFVWALIFMMCSSAWGDVSLNEFPDPILREYLRKEYDRPAPDWDADGHPYLDDSGNIIYFGKEDGILEDKEIERITYLSLGGKITSLKGWRYLTSLVGLALDCRDSQLTELDLDGCRVLTKLNCDDNQLTKLDLSGCTSLEYLRCQRNKIMELNLSDCHSIELLWCEYNAMTYLDLSSLYPNKYLNNPYWANFQYDLHKQIVSRDLKVEKINMASLKLISNS